MPDNIFPVTKVTMRKRPTPSSDPNVIRLRFLERPFRFYKSLAFHYKAFIKTAILSFLLIVPFYHFFYKIVALKSKAEILGKMDPGFTSDDVRKQIIDFKKRQQSGLVETYDTSELKKELGGEELFANKGVSPSQKKQMEGPKRRSYI